jgi:hypothetical protein
VHLFSRAWPAILAAALCAGGPAFAATAPVPEAAALYVPKKAVHSSFVIETNRKGQVTKVRARNSSGDARFDAMTMGNVVQTFVRKPDGSAIAGVYRMSYAFNPTTQKIKRTVELLQAGGVNPGAESLVDRMAAANEQAAEAIRKALDARNKPLGPVPLPFLSPSPAAAKTPH